MKTKLKDISVLVVEDELSLNEAYTAILKSEGITVDTSFDGAEALEKVGKKKFDIILLDLRMPKVDGLEFLREFADKPGSQQTKVVIFSNFDEQEDIDKAFALGAVRYMLKAWVSPKELIKLIKETAA